MSLRLFKNNKISIFDTILVFTTYSLISFWRAWERKNYFGFSKISVDHFFKNLDWAFNPGLNSSGLVGNLTICWKKYRTRQSREENDVIRWTEGLAKGSCYEPHIFGNTSFPPLSCNILYRGVPPSGDYAWEDEMRNWFCEPIFSLPRCLRTHRFLETFSILIKNDHLTHRIKIGLSNNFIIYRAQLN